MSYEHKQYGGGNYGDGVIATIISAIQDRLAGAAQRLAARIRGEQQETQQAVSRGELVPVETPDDTVEIGRDIDILHERYDRITGQYEDILAQASQVNEVVRSVGTALVEATGDVEADANVDLLKQRLEEYTDRWSALVARARGLHDVAQAIQDKITEIEGQLDGKSAPRLITKRTGLVDIEHKQWAQLLFDLGQASLFGTGFSAAARGVILLTRSVYERSLDYFLSEEDRIKEKLAALRDQQADLEAKLSEIYRAQNELENDFQNQGVDDEYAAGKSTKAFWDPEDDEDVAALTEKIDDLARRVEKSIRDNDEEEQAEIMAELRDLDSGLTDDTRFRVQALIERLGGGEKSTPGAHALYK